MQARRQGWGGPGRQVDPSDNYKGRNGQEHGSSGLSFPSEHPAYLVLKATGGPGPALWPGSSGLASHQDAYQEEKAGMTTGVWSGGSGPRGASWTAGLVSAGPRPISASRTFCSMVP